MTNIPVIAFAAYSGTGKTTLIEKLVCELKNRGLRLAVIKHDGHKFEIDHEGKDSWRFAKAGADITVISSAEKTAYVERGELSLEQLLGMIRSVDLILVEGFKDKNLPQIGIARAATGKGFPFEPEHFIALVTDMEVDTKVPCFGLNDVALIADFILERTAVKNTKDFNRPHSC